MAGRTRIGVVGTGYLGRLHARVLTEMPEVDAVGFVETCDETAAEVASNLGLRRFASVREMASLIDGAVVATPTISHAEVAGELIDAGRDVLIEKPITSDPSDARKLIELAAARGRIIQVGHVERYNPAIVVAAPMITEPRYLEADRLGVFSGRSLDIDVLLDLMIHDLHLVLSLAGSEVVAIQAVGIPVLTDKVDIANVRLELANGAVANLTASRVSSERLRKFRLFGHDSYLSIDTREQEVKGYRLRSDGNGRSMETMDLQFTKKEPLRAELEAFVGVIQTREQPLVSAGDGLAALELAIRVGEQIERSMARWR